MGNRLRTPSPAMARPPTPSNRRAVSGKRARRARMTFAPSWSPDSSPAIIHRRSCFGLAASIRLPPSRRRRDAQEREAEPVGGLHRALPVEDQRRAGPDGDARKPGPRGLRHGSWADRRHVDPQILPALRRLDQRDPRRTLRCGPSSDADAGPGAACDPFPPAPRSPGRARPRRRRPGRCRSGDRSASRLKPVSIERRRAASGRTRPSTPSPARSSGAISCGADDRDARAPPAG